MSPEVIIVAIGCYLFCGVSEKIYRIETGDWRTGGTDTDFQKELSEFVFVPNETSYEQVINKFGKGYTRQRTHRVIRIQEYNGQKYYFNREVFYIYRERYRTRTQMYDLYQTSNLDVYLFFKDKTYWDDPVYDWRKYFYEKGGLPCGETIFNSC